MKTTLIFLILLSALCADAQQNRLRFDEGGAAVEKSFSPRKKDDADFYTIYLRKYQMVEIKVRVQTIFLRKENECGVVFALSDDKGKEIRLGDSPAGINNWRGEIKTGRIHKIKIYMDCQKSFTSSDLQRKKPIFKYKLEITGSTLKTR